MRQTQSHTPATEEDLMKEGYGIPVPLTVDQELMLLALLGDE